MERHQPEWVRRFGAIIQAERPGEKGPLPQQMFAKPQALAAAEAQALTRAKTLPRGQVKTVQ
jgi:hypothetical protein